MNNIDDAKSYLDCVNCGKCLPVCPTYNISLNEFYSPRGRTRLVLKDNALPGALNPTKVNDSLSKCLLCGRCSSICPNGVKVDELIINEKSKIKGFKGGWPSKESFALKALEIKGKSTLNFALRASGFPLVKKIINRNVPSPSGKPFISGPDTVFKSLNGSSGLRVGYFSGCVFNGVYPHVSQGTVLSLTKNGIEVAVPSAQGCCGLPFLSSGDIKSFKELAIKNALSFKNKGFDYIVTSCASCSYSIKRLYLLYFGEEDKNYIDILDFSNKLYDVWVFFKTVSKEGLKIREGKLEVGFDAVFHIPCHLKTAEGFKPSSQTESIIGEAGFIADKILGLNIKPLKHDLCCGNGGMFNIRHYDLSKEITIRKFEDINEASPQKILTSCSGCMVSLMDQKGIMKTGKEIPVEHLISTYALSLKL